MMSDGQSLVYLLYIFLYIGFYLAFVFPQGYLFLHLTMKWEKFSELGFLARFPIYLAMGMMFSSFSLFFVGYLFLDIYLISLIFGAGWLLLFFLKKEYVINLFLCIKFRFVIKVKDTLPFVLFFSSLLFLATAAWYKRWPPAGDSVFHGSYVSLILYQKKNPLTLQPITTMLENNPIDYPLGFHVLSASISLLTGIYPGEAILLAATVITALIPALLYNITYMNTHSFFLSLLSFLAFYLIPNFSQRFLETFPLGYLYNGVYPCLLAILLSLCFICVICFEDWHQPKREFRTFLVLLFVAVTVLVTYPMFAVHLFLFLILCILQILKRYKRFLLVSIGIMLYALSQLIQLRSHFLWLGWGGQYFKAYQLSQEFLISNKILLSLLSLSFIISLVFIVRRIHLHLAFLYLIYFIPTMFSLDYYIFYNYLWFTAPSRVYNLVILLCFLILTLALHDASYFFTTKNRIRIVFRIFKTKFLLNKKSLSILAYVLIVILFIPTTLNHIMLIEGTAWWVTWNDNDQQAAEWIHRNVPVNELILNDRSYPGVFLLSLSIKKVVNNFYVNPYVFRCNKILDEPDNYAQVKDIIKEGKIKYIFITSDPFYFDVILKQHTYRKIDTETYVLLFDNNPYLYPVFKRGATRVYETFLVENISRKTVGW